MKKQKRGSVPIVVLSAIQSLLDLFPDQFKRDGSNDLMGLNNPRSLTHKKLLAYRLCFPNGTVGFTFPRADKNVLLSTCTTRILFLDGLDGTYHRAVMKQDENERRKLMCSLVITI